MNATQANESTGLYPPKPWTEATAREHLPLVHAKAGNEYFLANVRGRKCEAATVRCYRKARLVMKDNSGRAFFALGEVVDNAPAAEVSWPTLVHVLNTGGFVRF